MHLISVDLDGTCVRYEPRFEVDPVFLDGIRPHLGRGVRWVMNSDRSLGDMFGLVELIPEEDKPSAVLSRQKDIYLRNGDGGYVSHEKWNEEQDRLFRSLFGQLEPHFDKWEKEIDSRFEVEGRFVDDRAFAFRVSPDRIIELCDLMREMVAPWPEAQISGNDVWCFVLPQEFSKGRLLVELSDIMDVSLDKIIAVGDGINDLSMLDGSVTPLVGCPANSMSQVSEAVKQAGGVLATGHSAAGTLQVIEHYLNRAAPGHL